MDQDKVVGKVLLELINFGFVKDDDQEMVHFYLLCVYAAGHQAGRTGNSKARPVLQMDKDGKPVHVHESLKVAANTLHLNVATIGKALRGRLKTAGGYKWRYIDGKDANSSIGTGT